MPVGQPKMGESWWRDLTECSPLEKGMENHFSILAFRPKIEPFNPATPTLQNLLLLRTIFKSTVLGSFLFLTLECY